MKAKVSLPDVVPWTQLQKKEMHTALVKEMTGGNSRVQRWQSADETLFKQ